MSCFLKQSTAVDIAFGPFLDSVDGNTVEGSLTITQPDIRLKKNGGAWAQKSAAQTLSHEENGWYEISLSTTDTDTLGILIVAVHESGALPVWREFNVVSANVWDSLFGSDLLQVDSTQLLGSAYATPTNAGVQEVDLTHVGGDAQSATDFKDFTDSGYDPVAHQVAEVLNLAAVGNGAIGATSFAASAITSSALASNALTSAKIAPNALGSAQFATDALDADVLAADLSTYQAKVWVIQEGTTADHYAVAFYKNGERVTSGITSPTIQVIKGSDGTDLIASTALTEIGSTHRFKKDESTNKLVAGQVYFAVVSATIDGSSRTWDQQIGRDS